jgi:ABC-type nitrate/sulfonate/bicarbonate transport system substrate-binding protein
MGLSASNQRLAEKRSEVKRVIRALVRGLRFVRDRRDDTVAIMAQWLGQKPDVASKSYDLVLPGFSSDGGISDATMKAIVDLRVQTLGPKPASLDQLRDFAPLREVQKELKLH